MGPGKVKRLVWVGGLSAAAAVLACSSQSSSGGGTSDADVIGCTGQGDVYTANMKKPGTMGHLQFVLQSSMPGPPYKGNNTWTVQLLDASGKPLSGAMFTWLPGDKSVWMPEHGHGSQVTLQVTDNGDGTYAITPLYFFMVGLWQVTLQATVNGMTDTAVYTFCVSG